MTLNVAAAEMAIYVLYGILTVLPFFLITRFLVYDGQMVGKHRATWYLAVTYTTGVVSATLLSIGRAMFFSFGNTGGVSGSVLQGTLWSVWICFTLLQSVVLSLWPILARRVSLPVPNKPSIQVAAFGPSSMAIIVVAAACMLVECG